MTGQYFVYILDTAILSIGFYGLVSSKNLMKKIMSLGIMQSAVIILYVLLGFKTNSASPVYQEGISSYVNPLPQVLMLTAIVVGLAVSAVGYALILKINKLFGTLNSSAIDEKCFFDVSYSSIKDFESLYKDINEDTLIMKSAQKNRKKETTKQKIKKETK